MTTAGPPGALFGYGSLVNCRATPSTRLRPGRVEGWRRVWVQTRFRAVPFLSLHRAAGATIDGMLGEVQPCDWPGLDAREYAYARHPVQARTSGTGAPLGAAAYVVPRAVQVGGPPGPIRLSYLDTVVQGYLDSFGPAGVARFFATTDGWDRPVIDDRASPLYSRHQRLTQAETALVDAHLAALAAVVKELE